MEDFLFSFSIENFCFKERMRQKNIYTIDCITKRFSFFCLSIKVGHIFVYNQMSTFLFSCEFSNIRLYILYQGYNVCFSFQPEIQADIFVCWCHRLIFFYYWLCINFNLEKFLHFLIQNNQHKLYCVLFWVCCCWKITNKVSL